MKMLVNRIERTNVAGTSKKTGKEYAINNTTVYVTIPFETADGFGGKEMGYQFGDSSNFLQLEKFRGKLPAELDVELSAGLDQYGNPVTVVKSVNPINTSSTPATSSAPPTKL
jgi:hypothetical protein